MQATPVLVGQKVPTFTSRLIRQAEKLEEELRLGYFDGRDGFACPAHVADAIITCRVYRGFAPRVADLLTPPDAQHKLSMAVVPSYGMTLAHADMSGHELCPWRTEGCTATCVVSNGNGRYDSVQRAWLWRTDLWLEYPLAAAYRLGWELGRAVRKHGEILFRPDVNSDAAWHRVTPWLGHLEGVTVYGYTKNPAVLDARVQVDGGLHGFRYAYSWNERSRLARVQPHLARGGRVAVVTNRSKGQAVDAAAVRAFFGVPSSVAVVDADATDEWIVNGPRSKHVGVIGDLTAKGQARSLIGKSDFVVCCY